MVSVNTGALFVPVMLIVAVAASLLLPLTSPSLTVLPMVRLVLVPLTVGSLLVLL